MASAKRVKNCFKPPSELTCRGQSRSSGPTACTPKCPDLQPLADRSHGGGTARAGGDDLGHQLADEVTAARERQGLRQLGDQVKFLIAECKRHDIHPLIIV